MPILTGVPVALFTGPSRSAALAVDAVVFDELDLLLSLLPHAATSRTLRAATAAARRHRPRWFAPSVGSPMCPPGYSIGIVRPTLTAPAPPARPRSTSRRPR